MLRQSTISWRVIQCARRNRATAQSAVVCIDGMHAASRSEKQPRCEADARSEHKDHASICSHWQTERHTSCIDLGARFCTTYGIDNVQRHGCHGCRHRRHRHPTAQQNKEKGREGKERGEPGIRWTRNEEENNGNRGQGRRKVG